MKIKSPLCLFLFIFSLVFTLNASPQKKILVLNSYHDGLSWSDEMMTTLKRFTQLENQSVHLFIEYMDTKRYDHHQLYEELFQLYKKKYGNLDLDFLIVTDNHAYDFLLKYKHEIFGDIPCFFCGLNLVIETPEEYRGVFEITNVDATIDLIKKFHPKTKKITVIGDYSRTGILSVANFKQVIEKRDDSILYHFIQPETVWDLKKEIDQLEKGDILFYLLYNRDKHGNYYTYEESFDLSTTSCKVPIYCIRSFYMDRGAVGGFLTTAEMQGKLVAQMANKYLDGTPLAEIESEIAPQQLTLDFKELKRLRIKNRLVPDEAIVINRPFEFFRKYKEIVLLTLTIIVLLTVIIIVMTINIHLRKIKEERDKAHIIEMEVSNKKLGKAIKASEEANRLKSAFLANMSHEIRTPMNAIIGFTELLSANDLSEEKRNRFISIIHKNTNALLRLISDILDISKIETNQIKIRKERCNINQLFQSVRDNFESIKDMHQEKDLNFIVTLPKQSNVIEVHTDSMRLEQVFMNLLENSLKFTHEGEIEIGYIVNNQHLEFFVRDTGIGIPKEQQPIIFDRFRQADLESNTRCYGGTGLGLAISKSLIELLGGNIWTKSEENIGTTFFFTIPL